LGLPNAALLATVTLGVLRIRLTFHSVVARCRAGDFDDDDQPARLHGDLWSGNVIWTPDRWC